MMYSESIFQLEQELARYNELMFNKEILTQEEYEFCKEWDAEEAWKFLTNIGPDWKTGETRYLNSNVYSEVEKENFDFIREMGY